MTKMNVNLLPCSKILLDSNVIIYYIISLEITRGGSKIPLKVDRFTDQAHKIVSDFRDQDKIIAAPKFVLNEIRKKRLATIVDEYCDSQFKDLLNVDQINDKIRLHIVGKAKQKLKKFTHKDWFEKLDYEPENDDINAIRRFYKSLEDTEEMREHMRRKRVFEPCPAPIDMSLLCCSADLGAPLISNDTDITKFSNKLEKEGLCYQIINLREYR